jgi:hypothetical protein
VLSTPNLRPPTLSCILHQLPVLVVEGIKTRQQQWTINSGGTVDGNACSFWHPQICPHAWGLAERPSLLRGRSQRHRARPCARLAPCSLDGEPHITVSQGGAMLLVLHPDTLISSTSIASALDCPREAIVKQRG